MKLGIPFLLFIAVPTAMSMSDEFVAALHKTCVAESGVSEALIARVNTDKVFEDDQTLKCYIKCLMAQNGCIDEDGTIHIETAIGLLPEAVREKGAPAARLCAGEVGTNDACQNAWLLHKCFMEHQSDSMTDEEEKRMAALHKICVAETGVDEAFIDKLNIERVFEDDAKLKCYVKCLMEQSGCVKGDGTLIPECVIAYAPGHLRHIATPVIRNCGSKVGADLCESIWLTHKCYLENDPDVRYKAMV